MSCDSDLDCGTGRCECGVCTSSCASSADCSLLGFAGVECVPQAGVCGASGESPPEASDGESSACFLRCEEDADCSALGSGAVCESERCERPASVLADVGATGSASPTPLCDGSDDIRFLWVDAGSDGLENNYFFFAEARGEGFLAIDGQCRFWQAAGATDPVTSGTLSAAAAAAFSAAIGYERFAEYAPFDDREGCLGTGLTRIWSPASRAHCICACYEDPAAGGWRQVFNAMLDPALRRDPFAGGQIVTGPLRLALISYGRLIDVPEPWPLSRPPAQNETYAAEGSDAPRLDETSGVEITDPAELSALRATRDAYGERDPGRGFTPLVWTDPDTQQPVWFHMLLRDEVPERVQQALELPLF